VKKKMPMKGEVPMKDGHMMPNMPNMPMKGEMPMKEPMKGYAPMKGPMRGGKKKR